MINLTENGKKGFHNQIKRGKLGLNTTRSEKMADSADERYINKDITIFASQRMRKGEIDANDWTSSDFYMDPLTMSYFYLEALENEGLGFPKGWRNVGMDVEALTEDDKVVRISMAMGGGLQVTFVDE